MGSETMNARRELARTSLAAPPIAAPNAAKPRPPAAIAPMISGNRLQSMWTKSDKPPSMTSVTTIERTTPSETFSPRRAHLPTSPLVSRANAFSSRSSARDPATSRTVTNISVTVAATEMAKASRLGGEPETTSFCTLIGWAIEVRSGFARSRFWRASLAKVITRWRAPANGLSLGSSG